MAHQRKLGRTAGQRKALLRGLVTNLFQNGKIVTTEAKAKEVRRIAEHYITLAVNECDNTVTTTKITHNDKDQKVELQVVNDAPSKLHARRQMTAYVQAGTAPRRCCRVGHAGDHQHPRHRCDRRSEVRLRDACHV